MEIYESIRRKWMFSASIEGIEMDLRERAMVVLLRDYPVLRDVGRVALEQVLSSVCLSAHEVRRVVVALDQFIQKPCAEELCRIVTNIADGGRMDFNFQLHKGAALRSSEPQLRSLGRLLIF